MPRGPAPMWTSAAPHTQEAQPMVEAAFRIGYEHPVIWNGIASRDRATQLKRGLFNAARRHKPPVSVSCDIEPEPGGTFRITFVLHDKKVGRAYIVTKHGPNRSAWPYDTRRKGTG